MHPDVLPHLGIIASAAQQLICTVRVPATNIINAAVQVSRMLSVSLSFSIHPFSGLFAGLHSHCVRVERARNPS